MGFTEQIDSQALIGRDPVGYAPGLNPVTGTRHLLSDSENVWMPFGLTLDKRPGVSTFGNALPAGLQAIWGTVSEAETIVLTVLHVASGDYRLYYRLSGGSWVAMTDIRDIQASTQPHEMVWIREKLYIRATPASAGDKLGTAVFDETDQSVHVWGSLRPNTKPTFTADSGWNSSGSDTVNPSIGARYSFTYVTTTGHESSRSPFSDLSPIVSGKYPELTLTSDFGATTHPNINIYRSGDGGGGMFFIEQIVNPGAGAFTYEDTNFEPSGNFSTALNVARPAPTRTSNEPPPSVETGVLGTDPVERSSPIVQYGGRIYIAVGRNLYYTANDESVPNSGVLEESFRLDDTTSANKISFQGEIIDLLATERALLAWTEKDTYIITGTVRSEIRARVVYPGIGAYDRHCSSAFGDSVFWLDQDRQLRATQQGANPIVFSGALKREHIIASRRYQLQVVKRDVYDLVFISVIDDSDSSNTKQFVYDIQRTVWHAPWTMDYRTLLEFGYTIDDTAIGTIDLTVGSDLGSGFGATIAFSLEQHPAGNLINLRRVESADTVLQYIELLWDGDDTPTVTVRVNSLSTAEATTRSDIETSQDEVGYKRGVFYLDKTGDRFGLVLSIPSSTNIWSLLGAALAFEPLMGD